jgi:hypothetical protein
MYEVLDRKTSWEPTYYGNIDVDEVIIFKWKFGEIYFSYFERFLIDYDIGKNICA